MYLHTYSIFQWAMFFFLYCFVGWVIESTIVSIESKKFVNRGFMRGPFLPIYGFGAMAILFACLPVRERPTLVFLFGMLATTALEYFTGWLMETVLKTRYWDYSKMRFNIKGRVCLISSLFWGFLSLFLTDMLHSFTEKIVLGLPSLVVIIFDSAILLLFISDLTFAFKTAVDINKLLATLDKIKTELRELEEKIESDERTQWVKARIDELRLEYQGHVGTLGAFKRDFIRANPTARSSRFNDALVELRERIDEYKAQKK